MSEAKSGDTVRVHYTGRFEDGTQFDTSVGGDPLEFTIGKGEVIEGFEQAVLGMNEGETKTVTIPAAQAYGPHREDRVLTMDRKNLPADITPEVGLRLQARQPDDTVIVFTITDVNESTVVLDANHPLAGKDLVFDIELVEVRKA